MYNILILTDHDFTPAIVMKYIKHLRPNASPGPDGIPAEFFKAIASFVSSIYRYRLVNCLVYGNMPALLRSLRKVPRVILAITVLFRSHVLLVS